MTNNRHQHPRAISAPLLLTVPQSITPPQRMLNEELPHHAGRVHAAAKGSEQPFRSLRPAEPLMSGSLDRIQLHVRAARTRSVLAARDVGVERCIDRVWRAAVAPRPRGDP